MDTAAANRLYEEGGFCVCLKAPEALTFGIDFHAWTTGPLFKGLKLIPPGLHYLYWQPNAGQSVTTSTPQQGFFKFFQRRQVLLTTWQPSVETFVIEKNLQAADVAAQDSANLKAMDHTLGAYPLDPPTQYRKWVALTRHITEAHLQDCLPEGGTVGMDTALTRAAAQTDDKATQDRYNGFRPIKLKESIPPDSKGGWETMHYSQDKGWLLSTTITDRVRALEGQHPNRSKVDGATALLGEMQLAFICLLVAQNYDGFAHWKTLLHLILSSSLRFYPHLSFYLHFLEVLRYQLLEIPEDFMHDIISSDNFLRPLLITFFWRMDELVTDKDRTAWQNTRTSFYQMMLERFSWSLEMAVQQRKATEDATEDALDYEENDEDAPVVVALE